MALVDNTLMDFRGKVRIHDTLSQPSQEIQAFVSKLQTHRIQNQFQGQIPEHREQLQVHPGSKWQYPGTVLDRLFEAPYQHRYYQPVQDYKHICIDCKSNKDPVCGEASVDDCSKLGCAGNLVRCSRLNVQSPHPLILGTIVLADNVMKPGEHRDSLAQKDRIVGFEME